MRSVFYPHLVGGQHGDPALYVRNAHRREALLFDCGALANLPPREMGKIRHLFISHTHVDHFIGFDRLVRFFLYTDHQLSVYGPAGIAKQVGNRLASYTWNLTDGYPFTIEVSEWSGTTIETWRYRARNEFRMEKVASAPCTDGRLLMTPAYHVTATALTHGSITSLAFSLEEVMHVAIHKDALEKYGYKPGPWLTGFKDMVRADATSSKRIDVPLTDGKTTGHSVSELAAAIAHTEAGMKICYVTDASPTNDNLKKIATLARNAHMLAIEAPFAHADLERAQQRSHLTARLAGEVARKAGAKRCLFFHFSPRYQQAEIDLQQEALQAFTGGAPGQDAGQ